MPSAEYHRQWRAKHHDRLKVYQREWARRKREADPEAHRQNQRDWAAKNPYRSVLTTCCSNMRRKGLPCDIDELLVQDLVTDNCFYCGAAPDLRNGIDRVDNARGYVLDNVVSCCFQCNFAKSNMTLAEFSAWVARLTDRFAAWREVAV